MAGVYSVQMYAGQPANATPLFTCPAGNVAVVRNINVVVTVSGAAVSVGLSDNTAYIFRLVTTSAYQFFEWQGRAVMKPGQTISFFTNQAGAELWVSGYLFPS